MNMKITSEQKVGKEKNQDQRNQTPNSPLYPARVSETRNSESPVGINGERSGHLW